MIAINACHRLAYSEKIRALYKPRKITDINKVNGEKKKLHLILPSFTVKQSGHQIGLLIMDVKRTGSAQTIFNSIIIIANQRSKIMAPEYSYMTPVCSFKLGRSVGKGEGKSVPIQARGAQRVPGS